MKTHRLTCHWQAVELHIQLRDGLNTARRCDCWFCARMGSKTKYPSKLMFDL
jgi:hypothetical protein